MPDYKAMYYRSFSFLRKARVARSRNKQGLLPRVGEYLSVAVIKHKKVAIKKCRHETEV